MPNLKKGSKKHNVTGNGISQRHLILFPKQLKNNNSVLEYAKVEKSSAVIKGA